MHLDRLTVDILEHFRDAPTMRTVPAGTALFRAGDSPDFVYILMAGQANIMVGSTIVEIAGRGSLLGEMAVLDGKPRSAAVVARTECTLVPIDAAQFEALIDRMPEFARFVMNAMAGRMRRMNDNLRAAQSIDGVNARVIANTSLSMEEDATLPPVRSPAKRS
jgi:CRP-like cAMP-binding protein